MFPLERLKSVSLEYQNQLENILLISNTTTINK